MRSLRARRRWARRLVAALVAAGLAYGLLGVLTPSLLLTVAPGPAPDAATLVRPAGGRAAAEEEAGGRLLLTTVQAAPAAPLELWRALTDPRVDLAPRRAFVPAGMDDETFAGWSRAAMAESQLTAFQQAWVFLGRECGLESEGLEVFFVGRGGPGWGSLRPGDLITSWSTEGRSGRAILTREFEEAVLAAVTAAGPDAPAPGTGRTDLVLDIVRDGRELAVMLTLTAGDLARWPFLGLALGAREPRAEPPAPVRFAESDIGGPSGGLALALQIIDDFTPGDLAGGKVVAVSGTIGGDGVVGAVGGVQKKVAAAAAAGATVFLVPAEDYARALEAVLRQGLGHLQVIPVGSLAEAHQALVSLTGGIGLDYNRADLSPEAAREAGWSGR